MISELLYCDRRCGCKAPQPKHQRYQCHLAKYWEVTDMGDGDCLPWLYKICLQCCQSQMHTLNTYGTIFTCLECFAEEPCTGYEYLLGTQSKRSAQLSQRIMRYDSHIRCKLVNQLGDQFMDDLFPVFKLRAPFAINGYIFELMQSPWFKHVAATEKKYFLKNCVIPESMFPILYCVPGTMESMIEEENRLNMEFEDRRGSLAYGGDKDFKLDTALVNIHYLKRIRKYTLHKIRTYFGRQWVTIFPLIYDWKEDNTLVGMKSKQFH